MFYSAMRSNKQQNPLEFGEAKVSDLGSVRGGEQDIHGLEVKVKDRGAVVVEVHHAGADIPRYLVKLCMVQGRSVTHISCILGLLVSWCFEPSQLLGITSGLNTNSNLSLNYSARKSFNTNHNISTIILNIYTHKITCISTKTTNFLYHS